MIKKKLRKACFIRHLENLLGQYAIAPERVSEVYRIQTSAKPLIKKSLIKKLPVTSAHSAERWTINRRSPPKA